MKLRNIFPILILLYTFSFIQSCSDDEEGGKNETKISRHNEDESHNTGQNCMNCHFQGGSGEGWFTVAGTVYDVQKTNVFPNATVRLYSGPNGTGNLAHTIEVDERGNFYTTENIDFGTGLFVAVEGVTEKYMNSSISMGECNSCHGNTTDRIWTE